MYKLVKHIILFIVMLIGITQGFAQVAMPDTVCIGTTRTYKVNDASVPSTYTWRINGVIQTTTTNAITVTWNTAGVFTVSVIEHGINGCDGDERTGLVYVNPMPVANAGPDVTTCVGRDVQLNGSGGGLYQWSPPTYLSGTNIANPLVRGAPPGVYPFALTVTSSFGCTSTISDTVLVRILPAPKVFAGRDTMVTINQPLQLNAVDIGNAGFITYNWFPGSGLNSSIIPNPVAVFNRSNSYTYTVTARTADGCVAIDDINIKVFAAADIYVPSAFTPNGDGLNDIFKPILVGIKELKFFSIYNRYGQLIYTTSKMGDGWNGTLKGTKQPIGNYVWMAEAVDFMGNTLKRQGYCVLIQ